MAAYAALVSVMQIIHQIEHHPSPPISMDKKQVESITETVVFLQEFLEGYKSPFADGDEADPLEMRIADAVHAAEDVIESHIVDQILPAASATDLYESLVKMMKNMDLVKSQVMEIVAPKYQLERQVSAHVGSFTFADLYERMMKLIEHMDWIEKEVLDIVAVKYQLERLLSASAYFFETLIKVIEDMDLIKKEVTEIMAKIRRRGISASAGSSTPAYLYQVMVKLTEHMDLIKKEVIEIVALKDQLQIQVSASAGSSKELNENLAKVIEDMDLIKKEVMAIIQVKDHMQIQVSTSIEVSSFSRLKNTTMVGFEDVMLQLMEKLIYGKLARQVIPIIGMGGIGKTTLAEHVYAHPSISHHFDICARVTISQQFNTKDLLSEILSQVNKAGMSNMSKDELGVAIHKSLSYRRYLIVLDDMWSIEAWEEMQRYFPDNGVGSRIMVTTRLSNLGSQLDNNYGLEMNFIDDESGWNMFCEIVFRGESCPLELEGIGKKIVKSCKGLPLSIVVMGGLLEKSEPTKECWKSIRRSISSLVNSEDDKHCLKILKLSYNHMPVYLKPCFLYLGTFEEDQRIRVSTIIKLWVSEGFLKPIKGKSLETVAKEYLDELVDRNLILVDKFGKTGNMKYLKMHDLLRDLCLREAEKERFYHVVEKHSSQGMCSHRRGVISRNTSEEKAVDVMKSTPNARSYISYQERVQLLPDLKLLRILKATTYEDHTYSPEKMLNLRLLDVNSGGYRQYPSSISLHWSLQTLTSSHCENHHALIGSLCEKHNHAPIEIWNMSQLRHVCFHDFGWSIDGSGALNLPDPPSDRIVIMENLQTLKGVMNFKCDEMMVRRIPNIKKLGLTFERMNYREDDDCVHNIERLQKLESLKCFGYPTAKFIRKLTFPHSLKSLTLSMAEGCGMEDIMKKVSTLPLLQKLNLYNGYFTTCKWETVEGQFVSLKFLSLEKCHGLKCWMMESSSHFPCLERLHLLSLKDLKEIPVELGEIPTLKSVVLHECSESVVKSAKRMVKEQEELQGEEQLSFKVEVTLLGQNKELQSLANPNFQFPSWPFSWFE